MPETSPFVVDADWLEQRLGTPGLSIVDASWYLPAQKRNAKAEYDAAHIPGAIFFDQDVVVDPDSPLPHTLPRPEVFAQHVGSMGISADDTIVVYDGPGIFSAPRVWWMFRVMGVFQVYVLDGGFDGWKTEGRPVTAERTRIAPCVFLANFDAGARRRPRRHAPHRRDRRKPDRRRAAGRPLCRASSRNRAPGVRSGHMPGAKSVPALDAFRERKAFAGQPLARSSSGCRHRPVEAGRDLLRLGRHRGGRSRWRWNRSAIPTTSSMTGRGPNGAGGATRRS